MKHMTILFVLLGFFCIDPAAGQTGSHYYSRLHYDTSSVVYNNYITGIQYDEVHHRLYATMTSFNNYFPGDPRPRMYSQLLVLDPDNGDVLHSYIDTFPEGDVHSYENCTLVDSFIYWSGRVYVDSYSADRKENSVLLKTDLDLNPLWRIETDNSFKRSNPGQVTQIDDAGNLLYMFVVSTYYADEYFSEEGIYNGFLKISQEGVVYADTILISDDYYYNARHPINIAARGDGSYWTAGRLRQGTYLNNFVQVLDTNFHLGEPVLMDWFFYECRLNGVQRSHSPLEEYYVSGYKWDGGSSYAKGLNMKMDALGNPLWLYIQEGENVRSEFFMSALTPDDDIIMLGYGTMHMDTDPQSHGIVYKLNSAGDLQWMREIKESDDPATTEYLNYFVLLPGGDIVATGHTSAFDSSIMRRRQYGWLVRIDGYGCQEPGCQLLSAEGSGGGVPSFSIYPNPSDDGLFYLSFGGAVSGVDADMEIEVLDVSGRHVYRSVSAPGDSPHVIDIRSAGRGVYFISLKTVYGRSVRRVVYR